MKSFWLYGWQQIPIDLSHPRIFARGILNHHEVKNLEIPVNCQSFHFRAIRNHRRNLLMVWPRNHKRNGIVGVKFRFGVFGIQKFRNDCFEPIFLHGFWSRCLKKTSAWGELFLQLANLAIRVRIPFYFLWQIGGAQSLTPLLCWGFLLRKSSVRERR